MLILPDSVKPNRFKDLDTVNEEWYKSHAGSCVKRLLTRQIGLALSMRSYEVSPLWEFVFDVLEVIGNKNEKLLVYVLDALENYIIVNYKFYNAVLSKKGVRKILHWCVKEDV